MIRLEDVKMHFSVRKGLFKTTLMKAVDGVSLNIGKGEILALVGESGSGKTTLGRLTLRLLHPTAGRIFFEDQNITNLHESKLKMFRRRVQAVFQDPYSSIDPFMNIYQIVEEPLVIHRIGGEKERRELVYKTLEDVRLTPPQDFAEKYPHMISGGQRQRVGIARALVLNPGYIMADEPVSMIDASSRVEILQLLKRLQETYKIAFLYITHDIATARYFSDRVSVVYRGKVVETGDSEKVIENPLHPYTRQLIAAVPEPDPSNRFRERSVVEVSRLDEEDGVDLVEVEPDHYVANFKK
jgi:peptide/nickel transport system ATP-binding protein